MGRRLIYIEIPTSHMAVPCVWISHEQGGLCLKREKQFVQAMPGACESEKLLENSTTPYTWVLCILRSSNLCTPIALAYRSGRLKNGKHTEKWGMVVKDLLWAFRWSVRRSTIYCHNALSLFKVFLSVGCINWTLNVMGENPVKI